MRLGLCSREAKALWCHNASFVLEELPLRKIITAVLVLRLRAKSAKRKARSEKQRHTDNVKSLMGKEGSNSVGHSTGRKTADDDVPARKTRTTIRTSTN